jgi:hypothetical protein
VLEGWAAPPPCSAALGNRRFSFYRYEGARCPSNSEQDMNDTFRLDLADYDKDYIEDVLDEFLENAPSYGRKLLEIRVSQAMFDKLEIKSGAHGSFFKGIPVAIVGMPFDDTIEVVVGHSQ